MPEANQDLWSSADIVIGTWFKYPDGKLAVITQEPRQGTDSSWFSICHADGTMVSSIEPVTFAQHLNAEQAVRISGVQGQDDF